MVKMAIEPTGRHIACYFGNGATTKLLASSGKVILSIEKKDCNSFSGEADQLLWCGDDCIVQCWAASGIVLLGPSGNAVKLELKDMFHTPQTWVICVQELDCCRLVGNTVHSILQRVPEAVESIFHVGSTHDAAVLLDIYRAFDAAGKSAAGVRGQATDLVKSMESLQANNQQRLVAAIFECLKVL
jgi:hypothetical protein